MKTHECEHLSTCCGVGVAEYTDLDFGDDGVGIGFCGGCHEGAGFECLECEENTGGVVVRPTTPPETAAMGLLGALYAPYTCGECGEVVRDKEGGIDERVQAGMKCGHCAYG